MPKDSTDLLRPRHWQSWSPFDPGHTRAKLPVMVDAASYPGRLLELYGAWRPQCHGSDEWSWWPWHHHYHKYYYLVRIFVDRIRSYTPITTITIIITYNIMYIYISYYIISDHKETYYVTIISCYVILSIITTNSYSMRSLLTLYVHSHGNRQQSRPQPTKAGYKADSTTWGRLRQPRSRDKTW